MTGAVLSMLADIEQRDFAAVGQPSLQCRRIDLGRHLSLPPSEGRRHDASLS
jgi:hypothetical protein